MHTLNRYLATLSPLKAGKARIALAETPVRYTGEVTRRYRVIETAIAAGFILASERTTFRGEKVACDLRLWAPDESSFHDAGTITKTGLAYAAWLIEQRA